MLKSHASPAPAHPPTSKALRIDVTVPITRLGIGPMTFDPLATLIGAPISHLLEPLRVGPITQRPGASGTAVEIHPLALPDGEGLAIPLGHFGEVGFKASGGNLILTVPRAMVGWVQQRLAASIVRGPTLVASLDGTAVVAEVALKLSPGMRMGFPVGLFGEIGVEAG